MTDEIEEIEILPPEGVIPEDVMIEPKLKRGVSYPIFLLGLLLTAALGAAGGGAIAYYLKSDPVNLSPLQSDLSRLNAAVSELENRPQVKAAPPVNIPKVDLSGLEARLEALETAPATTLPEIDPVLLTRLEALQAKGSDALNLTALDLTAMEQRIDALETAGVSEDVRAELQEIYERVAEWEIRLDNLQTDISQAEAAIVAADPIARPPAQSALPFPKAALLAAAKDQPAQGGFFKRAMNKHIQVKDEDNPAVMIDAMEAALSRGDIDTAKAKFDQLPSTIRSAGQDWRNSLK